MLIKLPRSVTNVNQVVGLVTELKSGTYDTKASREFFDSNPRITRDTHAIKMLIEYLEGIIKDPTEMLISFAQRPDEEFVAELTDWARVNIRGNILLRIKIDPMLTGGIVVRSPQRIYDFSWNNSLSSKRDLLIESVNHAS